MLKFMILRRIGIMKYVNDQVQKVPKTFFHKSVLSTLKIFLFGIPIFITFIV